VPPVIEHGEAMPESNYGRRKMTAFLRRQGLTVSKRQMDRLMRQSGIKGLVRGEGVRTTIPDKTGRRAPDLRLLLANDRGLACLHDEDDIAGAHSPADGVVASRPRWSPGRARAAPPQRCWLPAHERFLC